MDAFFYSVEVLRREELRDKQVIVAGEGPRSVITTASYEARKLGVGSGMPVRKAKKLAPHAIYVKPDLSYYKQMSEKWLEVVRALDVPIERVSMDECYLELGSNGVSVMREVVKKIQRQVGLSASVGIGDNKLIAKVASDAEKPAGFVVLNRQEAMQRFGDHSPQLLPGIGPKTTLKLSAMGVSTISELQEIPQEDLVSEFGERSGKWLKQRSLFLDSSPVEERERKSISVEETFNRDLVGPERLQRVVERQSAELARDAQKLNVRGRTVSIKVRLADFTTATRSRTISHATNQEEVIKRNALALLKSYAPSAPVRLLGVRLSSLTDG